MKMFERIKVAFTPPQPVAETVPPTPGNTASDHGDTINSPHAEFAPEKISPLNSPLSWLRNKATPLFEKIKASNPYAAILSKVTGERINHYNTQIHHQEETLMLSGKKLFEEFAEKVFPNGLENVQASQFSTLEREIINSFSNLHSNESTLQATGTYKHLSDHLYNLRRIRNLILEQHPELKENSREKDYTRTTPAS